MSVYINTDHQNITRLVTGGQSYIVRSEDDAQNLIKMAKVVKDSRAQQAWDAGKLEELVAWEDRLFAKHGPDGPGSRGSDHR